MTENNRSSELKNIKIVCNAELPATYIDSMTGKKLHNEAYVASKVEEARIESERAGIYWVRNKVVTSGRDESGKFYLLDDAFVSEVDAYLDALQSKEGDK